MIDEQHDYRWIRNVLIRIPLFILVRTSEPVPDPILPNFRGMLWFNQTIINIETEIFHF